MLGTALFGLDALVDQVIAANPTQVNEALRKQLG